jgi:hypothetical protein
MPDGSLLIDLGALPEEVELSRCVSEAVALAASVVVDRFHGGTEVIPAEIHQTDRKRTASVRPVPVDDVARASFGDPQEATEDGGEAIGLSIAYRMLSRVAFRRLPKHTGADYLVRPKAKAFGDDYERLECSGIGDGSETASSRVQAKILQIARYPEYPPGHAVVTSFRASPIEIQVEAWRK